MAEDKKIVNETEDGGEVAKVKESKTKEPKEKKPKEKKPGFFKKLGKFFKDTNGELKKVAWTPKSEVWKSFKLVIATVVIVALIIAAIDLSSSWIINSIAGLIG